MRKGTKHTPETKEKLSAAHKGRKHSAEHKEKIRVANTGKKLSEQTKEILTIKSIISGNKAKPVLCITTGEKFSSQKKAAICLFGNNMDALNISACCKGKLSHFHGYQFKYI